jgi:hypothetical protein
VPAPAPTSPPIQAIKVQGSEPKAVTQTAAFAQQEEKSSKRKGPLPLWLAEIMLIELFAGFTLSITKYSGQSSKAGYLREDCH